MKRLACFAVVVGLSFSLAGCGHKHTSVVDSAIAPTCITSGLTEGAHCSECNEVLVEQKIVDALGHTIVIDEAIPATKTSTGLSEGSHCSACGQIIIKQDIIPQEISHEAPYCPGDFSKIGKKFSEFHVAGSGLQYSQNSLYILMVQEFALTRTGWEAYTDHNGYSSRVGVANDRIVFNVQEIASGTHLSEALPNDMLNVVPLISYGTDENGYVCEAMLIWKGDNGYMVGFTGASGYPNGNYLDEHVKYFISTVDLGYILGMPEAILAANPAY